VLDDISVCWMILYCVGWYCSAAVHVRLKTWTRESWRNNLHSCPMPATGMCHTACHIFRIYEPDWTSQMTVWHIPGWQCLRYPRSVFPSFGVRDISPLELVLWVLSPLGQEHQSFGVMDIRLTEPVLCICLIYTHWFLLKFQTSILHTHHSLLAWISD